MKLILAMLVGALCTLILCAVSFYCGAVWMLGHLLQ